MENRFVNRLPGKIGVDIRIDAHMKVKKKTVNIRMCLIFSPAILSIILSDFALYNKVR